MTATSDAVVHERPILFSGGMVRAILDGRKTQTRRVVKPQPTSPAIMADPLTDLRAAGIPVDGLSREPFCVWMTDERNERGEFQERGVRCPYGAPGDRLWVRETWAEYSYQMADNHGVGRGSTSRTLYRADEDSDVYTDARWRPSIHMPRWAARLTLEITEVRVQRLQEISEDDAIAEGAEAGESSLTQDLSGTARGDFARIWNELNAARGHGWETTPWVWVLTFRLLQEGGQ